MKKTKVVTFLAVTVVSLVSAYSAVSEAAASVTTLPSSKKYQTVNQNKTVLPADLMVDQDPIFNVNFSVSRSTSLVNFQDGTKRDGMDYMLNPSFKMKYGSLSTRIIYSQNLNEPSPSAGSENSDWADVPVSFAFNSYKLNSLMKMTPSLTAVLPVSQTSIKRDQLQTTLIAGLNFGLTEGKVKKDGSWAAGFGITAGRSFHAYEENINGSILNQYLSNQSLNVGYTYKVVSFSVDLAHKTRWSYHGEVKDGFEIAEELGYAVNDHFSITLGHSNSGSSLRPDGSESNFKLVSDNDSTVYVQMGVSF